MGRVRHVKGKENVPRTPKWMLNDSDHVCLRYESQLKQTINEQIKFENINHIRAIQTLLETSDSVNWSHLKTFCWFLQVAVSAHMSCMVLYYNCTLRRDSFRLYVCRPGVPYNLLNTWNSLWKFVLQPQQRKLLTRGSPHEENLCWSTAILQLQQWDRILQETTWEVPKTISKNNLLAPRWWVAV